LNRQHIFGVSMFMVGAMLVGFLVYHRWTQSDGSAANAQVDARSIPADQQAAQESAAAFETENPTTAPTPLEEAAEPAELATNTPHPAPGQAGPGQLELIEEHKLFELYPEVAAKQGNNLGASGVLRQAGYFYVVLDGLTQLARIPEDLSRNSADVPLLGRQVDASIDPANLSLEDIAYNDRDQRFYILAEASRDSEGVFRARVEVYSTQFLYQDSDWLPFVFEEANKGFEGLTFVHRAGNDYLLALCEGNNCRSDAPGREPGGGRIQVFQETDDGWVHAGTINLPEAVRFEDYAGLDILDERVAIVSQASQQLWVGALAGSAWEFVQSEGQVVEDTLYAFPGDQQAPYCNVEGIFWLTPDQIVAVSDQAQEDQPSECRARDQSIHLFRLP
jgi:hypothetical protein